MGNRRVLILVIAVALAGLTAFLTFHYANSADERAFKDAQLVSVYLVKKDIPKGLPGEKALDEGYIARDSIPRKYFPAKAITNLPLVVLVNRGTAGAAEIVAAAVLDNARGDVLGDKTFGDGSVQKLLEVPDGSALILSIAKYYTPQGKVIQETGITPNIQVASVDDTLIPDDEDNSANPEENPKPQTKEDEQLRRAIEVLNNKAKKAS